MNQTFGWLVLLTLIVWSKCNPQLESPLEDQWEASEDEDSASETDSQLDNTDMDQSVASSNVQAVKNQTDLSGSLAHLIKSHNLYPQLEGLKRNPTGMSSEKQKELVNSLLKNLVGNSSAYTPASQQAKDMASKSYDMADLKRYYEQIKSEEPQPSTRDQQMEVTEAAVPEYHSNHNYFSNADWRPLISTTEHRFAPPGMSPDSYQVPSSRVASFSNGEMPTALANFYVDTDQHLLHAHESQNLKDLKEVKDVATNLATVKDHLISTKDPSKEKITHASHKPSYVPVQEGDKYQEYMSCCEQLFKNYGNKDYYNEDIYLVPKGEEHLHRFPQGHPLLMNHPPVKMGYLRGFPVLEHEVKVVGGGGGGAKEYPPDGGHVPVQCIEERHHPGHFMPRPYHSSIHRGSHGQHGMFQHPPAALLLKKKLALIGKKYLFGK